MSPQKSKGQGALEYLLLIGGAILIGVIVIALLVGISHSKNKNLEAQIEDNLISSETLIPAAITKIYCNGLNYVVWLSEFNTDFNYVLMIDEIVAGEAFTSNPMILPGYSCDSGQIAKIIKKNLNEPYGVVVSTEVKI